MEIKHFAEANWNSELLENLEAGYADGLEVSFHCHLTSQEKILALELIASSIKEQTSEFDCWIVTGHTALQPDNRIIEHRKLWKSLGVQTAGIDRCHVAEWVTHFDGGVRYFGVLRQPFVAQNLLSILAKEQISWIIISPPKLEAKYFENLLKNGWGASTQVVPSSFIKIISREDLIFLKDFGSPAQGEVGAIVIGKKERIAEINKNLLIQCRNTNRT